MLKVNSVGFTLATIVLLLGVSFSTIAVGQAVSPADPTLRLWLKADDIATTRSGVDFFGNPVEYVDSWPDSSMYNHLIATQNIGEPVINNDVDNHTPQLVTVTGPSGKRFSAVNFRQEFDPVTPDVGSGYHYSDRMYQQNFVDPNNIDPNFVDPLDISGDMSVFIVYNNLVAAGNSSLGTTQCVLSKRGPASCPYQLGYQWGFFQFPTGNVLIDQNVFVTYTANVVYASGMSPTPVGFGLVGFDIVGTTLSFKEYYLGTRWGEVSAPIDILSRNPPNGDGTPFGIAMHAQGAGATAENPWGNGAYERFAGQIAEIIIYARPVVGPEREAIENYLLAKYFGPFVPENCGDTNTVYMDADINRDCNIDLKDYAALAASWSECSDPADPACDPFWP